MPDSAQTAHPTRESWLVAATAALAPRFAAYGRPLPARIRVTCGWPSEGGKAWARRRIGECWHPAASADRTVEVFIAPTVADSREVLAILIHELIHAALGPAVGHRWPFKRAMGALGLAGHATASVPAGDFDERYGAALAELGGYPHAALNPGLSGRRTQGTRMLKAGCPSCGYTFRLSRMWAEAGLPDCVCGAGRYELQDCAG